jgi:hypothetical protein
MTATIEIGRFIVLRPRLPDLEKGNSHRVADHAVFFSSGGVG